MKNIIANILKTLYRLGAHVIPVRKNVILFESSVGRNYSGNPRYIYEELVRQGKDKKYHCVWIFENPNVKLPGNCVKVKRARLKYLYYMIVAKVWVFDCRQPMYLIKRSETTYIQTWHGTPLKKLALDMDLLDMDGSQDIKQYHDEFRENTKTWDYLLAQNKYSQDIFRRCFAFEDKPILEGGYPRNDILIRRNSEKNIVHLKKKLGLPMDKKIILYAPTWRDNETYGNGRYQFASKIDFKKLQEELQDEYVFIVKYHYLVSDKIDWSPYKDFVYQFDETRDIALLYLVSDMLITDYSSVMFDYSILKRPMLFFAYDLEYYRENLRGFYFDFLEEAPGPISRTNDELIRDIREYDSSKWKEKYEIFSNKYNKHEDGKAANRVIAVIDHAVIGG
ncbi:MAG: CDP-glycerol glycerophosphotransferase family protein [Anaerostipes sp.]|jgi:CDP-glycerol glycerophosphotransferase